MSERIMEIIVYLVNEMRERQMTMDGGLFESMSQKLVKNGYTENEINSAVTWVIDKMEIDSDGKAHFPVFHSYRLLNDFEKLAISPGAYGYLLQIRELELIDEMDMEQIIERALIVDQRPISAATMKEIVVSVLFQQDDLNDGSFFLLDDNLNIH